MYPVPKPSKDYQDAVATGRRGIYCMDLGGATLIIAVINAWAKKGSPAAARTDDLLTVIQMEHVALPEDPKMIAGDLNGTVDAFDV